MRRLTLFTICVVVATGLGAVGLYVHFAAEAKQKTARLQFAAAARRR